ncbi:orotate phosphoribosyltransferase [Microbulbifer thermotolerans]|uniref:Orotate phosphoribosyltransferase n=1 Tax=Microbulbifer thermotolerans TaxID=252514 RepID=A0A143HQ60_MICTH|nr:orotate phosphoribosyltransferase [Microbulbifer thermotolerans]AMX03864.1 orotate phosphoribosyltransferase [Microbulbifer thermotolerans]MCX2778631.1 orotate phosphoribosyltransferase [Microbulbifer thermotolerans]MCX2782820.1 orotate phosphoribosyltransferase [Microbulbifer thermotolerans]MCX2794101.1 orotate phosphoribosyltransferase [Microbulbifer thermotolerans]MCX2802996.1 orotate phosphoribosyltransferase [Microbulbifer thermotolerans]
MQQYQRDFIQLALDHQVLCFGDFTLKSGRRSPYFFNAGRFHTGAALAALGQAYAEAILASGVEFDVIFGPAYKGIPLGAVTAVALAKKGVDKPFCYNRKEAKDHGEGGTLVGAPLVGKVLIIDDVITAGTAVREVMQIISEQGAEAAGVVIGLNRQERAGEDCELSAIQKVEQQYNIPVISIVQLDHIISYLKEQSQDSGTVKKIEDYRQRYGAAAQ